MVLNETIKPDRHYFIVNRANGHVLSPAYYPCTKGYALARNFVSQYNLKKYKDYQEPFKWRVTHHEDFVQFNNKSNGMWIGIDGKELRQTTKPEAIWKIQPHAKPETETPGWGMNLQNALCWTFNIPGIPSPTINFFGTKVKTGIDKPEQYMALASANVNNTNDTRATWGILPEAPEVVWSLVEANKVDLFDTGVSEFKLQEDFRDNAWFKLAVPNPADLPEGGATVADKIEGFGKLIGIFPDQNEFEELYKALVIAMKQIVNQAFIADNLNDLLGILGAARSYLDTDKDETNPEKIREALGGVKRKYDDVIHRIMGEDIKEAGLAVFMQAASEQLVIIHLLETLFPGSTMLADTTHKYAVHLRKTFQEMREKRLALVTKGGRIKGFIPAKFMDAYQFNRIGRYGEGGLEIDEHKEIMRVHFDTELGDPLTLADDWLQAVKDRAL